MEGAVSAQAGERIPEKRKTYGEIFEEVFPHYLAMGMTWGQFWEQDCSLVKAYRKAWEIRQEHENQMAWLQGLYIYDALNSTPIIVSGFAKGTPQHPKQYPDKPYDFGLGKKKKTEAEIEEERKQASLAKMQEMMARFNQSFRKRQKEAAEKNKQADEKSEQGTVP